MKLKFNGVLKFFKNISNKQNKEKNFFKNKNKILIIFASFFAIFIAAIVVFGLNAPPVGLDDEKTMIFIPTKKELTDSEMFEIKETASDVLNTECFVQQTANEKELNIIDEKPQIKISLNRFLNKNIPQIGQMFENLKNSLNKKYPKLINIKNKNEMSIENYSSNFSSEFLKNLLFIVSTILLIVFLYFIFSYRKIGGFSAFSSFFVSLILNILAIAAMFMALVVGFFSLEITSTVILKFAVILTIAFLNLFLNFCTIFNSLKLTLKEQNYEDKNNPQIALNGTINSVKGVLFNNYLIFSVIPSICFLIFNLINLYFSLELMPQFLALAAINLAIGLLSFSTSVYFIPNFFIQLKKTRVKKHKKEKTNKVKA